MLLGIAGPSDSGKTTLIEKVLPLLRAEGLVVSTIKHVHHTLEVDVPGKDSFRHRKAGAAEVMIALPDGWVLHHPASGGKRPALDEIVARMSVCDLVLVEGFRDMPVAQVQLVATDKLTGSAAAGDDNAVAVVGIQKPLGFAVPAFQRDDAQGIARFITQFAHAST